MNSANLVGKSANSIVQNRGTCRYPSLPGHQGLRRERVSIMRSSPGRNKVGPVVKLEFVETGGKKTKKL
jgi:hypothetical protein